MSDRPVEDDLTLDIFGQNPRLSRLYTQLCFCFILSNTDAQSQQHIVEHLQGGLVRLCHHFPWLAGRVVRDSDGIFRIRHDGSPAQLVVQDCGDILPSMTEMQTAGFPFAKLDESIVAACKTLPDESSDLAPVLAVKVTLVHGGLVLNFDAQHNCMDMAGLGEVIRLFAKACRREEFSRDELLARAMPRHPVLSLVADEPVVTDAPHLSTLNPSHSPTTTVWSGFVFSATSLAALKAVASETKTGAFVSTDDALSALLWQAITRARAPDVRHHSTLSNATSAFERQIDARTALGIAAGYIGNVVDTARAEMAPWDAVMSASLGDLASRLRESIGTPEQIATRLEHRAASERQRLRASLLETPTSVERSSSRRRKGIPMTNLRFSSWAKEQCGRLDFGPPLRWPAAVRRPLFEAWEGLGYFMPKGRHGEIAVTVCLTQEATDRLRTDESLSLFSTYVG